MEENSQRQEIESILFKAAQHGYLVEVTITAFEEMQKNKTTTPLLALQIAINKWLEL